MLTTIGAGIIAAICQAAVPPLYPAELRALRALRDWLAANPWRVVMVLSAVSLAVFGVLAFNRNRRVRRVALIGAAVAVVGFGSAFVASRVLEDQVPEKTTVLVAEFRGPQPERYQVTETILGNLRTALEPYDDVEVGALGKEIREQDPEAAIKEGRRRKAAVVIWGRYSPTENHVGLAVHFTLLNKVEGPQFLGPEVQGQLQKMSIEELDNFVLQTRLSQQMAYLTLAVAGTARYAVGDLEKAITYFTGALAQSQPTPGSNHQVIYYYRAAAYYHTKKFDLARKDADKTIELDARWNLGYNVRGALLYEEKKFNEALKDFERAIELDPKLASAYTNRGNVYYELGDTERALADHNRAIELDPKEADAFLARGNDYLRKEELDRAIEDYNRAIELDPEASTAYWGRGNVYYRKGDVDRALADHNRAIQIDPTEPGIYVDRGNDYSRRGDAARALADHNRAIQIDPKYAVAYVARGNDYYGMDDTERALKDYNQAILLDPRYVVGYLGRGAVYYDQRDFDRALADFNQSIELDPAHAGAYIWRARLYRARGQNPEAIADLETAARLSKDPQERTTIEDELRLTRG